MATTRPRITLIKSGNRLVVSPTTARVFDILTPELTFIAKNFIGDVRKRERANVPMEFETNECFSLDHKDRIGTSFGFYRRVSKRLRAAGYRVRLRDLTPHPNPKIFDPLWDRIFGADSNIELRHGQDEFLIKVLGSRHGRIDCPPGYGKSFLIGLICKLLPKAKIHVITRRVPVLRERIYPELAGMLPDVGIVGGGLKRKDHRVMCYTAGSLGHSDGDADIMIGDECHELAADSVAGKLARYDRSRNFGLSASHDMRLDNKDKRVEAIFGPLIYKIPYAEAEAHGMVVPIEVHWRDVVMGEDPCAGHADMVEKKRHGIWMNDTRNDMIAEDANLYDDDVQVLIPVETVLHAVQLKRRLPGFDLVYSEAGMPPQKRQRYIKRGWLGHDEPRMTVERRIKVTKLFERGKIKKAICTTVWNVGVDFKQLSVLIRADAGGSPINDIQLPGRASRIAAGKGHAVVHDYRDLFNTGFRRKSTTRRKSYEAQDWTQVLPDAPERDLEDIQLGLDFGDDD